MPECCGELLIEPFFWISKGLQISVGCVREWEYYRCPRCNAIRKFKIENWWEKRQLV